MLEEIKAAALRLQNVANKTPVMTSRTLNKITCASCYLKCDNFQRVGAFKFRGAYNAISQLTDEQKKNGVITHSSGNHAQAVSYAGFLFNVKTVIVMPTNAPEVKVDATRNYGAEIHFCEPTQSARETTVNDLIKKHGYTLVHPYDNLTVIHGAGTAAWEFLQEIGKIDIMMAPVGGGGLLSGTSAVSKESGLVTKVFGAEPLNANDAWKSFHQGALISQSNPLTIADGLRTSLSELTFKTIRQYVDEIITVTELEIISAMKFLWERMKIVVEPSGAVPLAAVFKLAENSPETIKGSKIGLIISGGNVDLTNFFSTLKDSIKQIT